MTNKRNPKQRMIRMEAPRVAEICAHCGRKLDTRMFDNPYGTWAIPIVDGRNQRTLCEYCFQIEQGKDPKAYLPAGCKALEYLKAWLAVPGFKEAK